ncbi:MAG: septal ring lytic transglycosylase RlpA family protein [Candidatus Sulfotelmatobacter sp.]
MTVVLLITLLLLAACGHPKQARVEVQPAPAPTSVPAAREPAPSSSSSPSSSLPAATPQPHRNDSDENDATDPDLAEPSIPAGTTPIATETGMASWYGPPYHNRRGSNGEVYNMHAMTAAHRTLPLGSIVRVTNLKTSRSALVRITDRGPFIPGRVLDLSLAAARKLDVYGPGTAEVKVEVLQTPAPLDSGGKWAVQIGSFPDEGVAIEFADHLTRRYRTAKVLRFASPAGGWWIRIRVLDDDHDRAQQMVAETRTSEGAVFLVRLD